MNRYFESRKRGEAAEKAFQQVAEKQGAQFEKSTERDDIHKHIDCFVTWTDKEGETTHRWGIDVKAAKSISRGEAAQDSLTWLEYQNVGGKDGWMKGHADFIAFERADDFVLLHRPSLLAHIEAEIPLDELHNPLDMPPSAKRDQMVAYRRRAYDRQDTIILVNLTKLVYEMMMGAIEGAEPVKMPSVSSKKTAIIWPKVTNRNPFGKAS